MIEIAVFLGSVGSDSDHAVADQYAAFLHKRGFNIVERARIGMRVPPPEHKITIRDNGAQVTILIAPNA